MKKAYYKNWDELPLIMTIGQVAILLGKSYETIRLWAKAGNIPAVKIGDEWRVEKNALRRFFDSKEGAA